MSANWEEVEELFANAEGERHRWRDAVNPDSEKIVHQLQAVLREVKETATQQYNNIRQRIERMRGWGMSPSDEEKQEAYTLFSQVQYLNDALDKTNRQLAAITSEDALSAEMRQHGYGGAAAATADVARHDWSDLLRTIGDFLATWKLKNLHEFVKYHAKNLEQDVIRLMMSKDPDKKISTDTLIFEALDIDKVLRTIQNISSMSPEAIYEVCPDLDRAQPTPSPDILRNQCFEDRIKYILAAVKHMSTLKQELEENAERGHRHRGDIRREIHEKVDIIERIIAGRLSQRPRRRTTDYSTTYLSPIVKRALRTTLHALTLLESKKGTAMELKRVKTWTEDAGVTATLQKLSRLKLDGDIKEQIGILQDAIQRRAAAMARVASAPPPQPPPKLGGHRTRRRRRGRGHRRTRHKRRHKRRKSRRRRRRRRGRRRTRR